jgi:primosomal protein N' (replication factor Y)
MSPLYAEVVLPLPLRRSFTYLAPEELAAGDGKNLVGRRVQVPFGRQGRLMGYVVGASGETELPAETLKPIAEVLDQEPIFSAAMLGFTRWVAGHYAASWGEVLRAAHPASLHARERKTYVINEAGRAALRSARLAPSYRKILERAERHPLGPGALRAMDLAGSISLRRLVEKEWLAEEREFSQAGGDKRALAVELIAAAGRGAALTARESAALAYLRERGGQAMAADLSDVSSSPHALVRQLQRKGLVRVFPSRVMRDPFWDKPAESPSAHRLTAAQQKALDPLMPLLEAKKFAPALLHGVTGSGKTEIYIRLARRALETGRRALYLVPEIGLTPQAAARLRGHFGEGVAILHSGLGLGERHDQWERIRRGGASLVVGTRSAVFAPLDSLGLVIVDEEHDSSYKQEESPYYHARDLALVRGQREGALVVLGSATPSTESYRNAQGPALASDFRSTTRRPYLYVSLPERVTKRPLPEIELVDMGQEFRETGRRDIFSRRLEEALRDSVSRGEQAVLLLNRRGYAPFVLCRDCGFSPECAHCSVALTPHLPGGRGLKDAGDGAPLAPAGSGYMLCHYCGYREGMRPRCPRCEGEFLQMVGFGTEQLEHRLRRSFENLRVLRLDRDTAGRKDAHHRILSAFARREADVLVGTQMIAKGHDFPEVTLAGVVSADTGLGFPDFRAAERTFQILTQVAGRAGRAGKPGRVLVQTLCPNHYAIECAARYDENAFYGKELWFRRVAKYPPFTAMAVVLVQHEDEKQGVRLVRRVAGAIRDVGDERVQVLGPAPAPLAKLKDVYRFHVILKSPSRGRIRDCLDKAMANVKQAGREAIKINIDPVNLL